MRSLAVGSTNRRRAATGPLGRFNGRIECYFSDQTVPWVCRYRFGQFFSIVPGHCRSPPRPLFSTSVISDSKPHCSDHGPTNGLRSGRRRRGSSRAQLEYTHHVYCRHGRPPNAAGSCRADVQFVTERTETTPGHPRRHARRGVCRGSGEILEFCLSVSRDRPI